MSRLRPWAALAVCLALVAVLTGLRPASLADARSFPAGPDGWAHAPSASGRVLSARLARSVVRPRNEEPLVTGQVFVVAELEVQVRNRSLGLSTVILQTADGHRYRQLDDSGIDSLTLTDAGFSNYGNAVFEVPPERVPGATLIVGAQSDMLVIYRAQLAFSGVVHDFVVADRIQLAEGRTEVTR